MKQDLALVRDILLRVEDSREPVGFYWLCDELAKPREEVAYQLRTMRDDGLIRGTDMSRTSDTPYKSVDNVELTGFGHKFIAAARNETIWKMAMDKVAATVPGAILAVSSQSVMQQLLRALGLAGESSE